MAHFSDLETDRPATGRADDGKVARGNVRLYRAYVKRALDIAMVVAAAPFLLPLIAILALLIRRDGGPVFFSQNRIGMGGRPFRLWKLRTMVVDAETRLAAHLDRDPAARAEWNKTQKLKNDPRITTLGRLLRKSSLDELPQLWNVLRGDMSLVGPRPMMPAQRVLYPGRAYYRMRPGLTGFWQISDRNETSFAKRALYDTQYARRMSLVTDVIVLILTVRVVLRGTGY
jgi:exopolysaccharide production protein ExoY